MKKQPTFWQIFQFHLNKNSVYKKYTKEEIHRKLQEGLSRHDNPSEYLDDHRSNPLEEGGVRQFDLYLNTQLENVFLGSECVTEFLKNTSYTLDGKKLRGPGWRLLDQDIDVLFSILHGLEVATYGRVQTV